MPAPLVLVDARNAMRSRWPNIGDEQFVELARAWTEREEVDAVLVFDGSAPGEAERDERVRLVGTGAGSADDWIAEQAARLAREGRRLWLVTSDRGLRERVGPHAERTIGGGSFAAQLLEP